MNPLRVRNTDKRVLSAVAQARGGGVTALDVVNVLWSQSRQPMKKALTVGRYFRRLAGAGLVRERGGRYFLTPTSRSAYLAPLGTYAGHYMRLA